MIRISFLRSKNELCRPNGWGLRRHPESAFYGGVPAQESFASAYTAKLAVTKNRSFEFSNNDWNHLDSALCLDPCKIEAEEGLPILRTTERKHDEIILLVAMAGEQNEIIGDVLATDAEILRQWKGYAHGCPVIHLVARLTSTDGHVAIKIRRWNGHTEVAIFSWRSEHFLLEEADYEQAVQDNSLFAEHETLEQEIRDYQCLLALREQSRRYKSSLKGTDRLRKLSALLSVVDKGYVYSFQDETYIFVRRRDAMQKKAFLYSEINISTLEARAAKVQAKASMQARAS